MHHAMSLLLDCAIAVLSNTESCHRAGELSLAAECQLSCHSSSACKYQKPAGYSTAVRLLFLGQPRVFPSNRQSFRTPSPQRVGVAKCYLGKAQAAVVADLLQ